ncbi:MAG TPA: ABC transporter permease [Gammaproteobacteria bacterium]|jgi:ABC-2 type transport system permease protein
MSAWVIAWRELRNLFLSPLAWVLLAVVQFIHAWMFLSAVENFRGNAASVVGVTDQVAAGLFSIASIVMLLIVPLLSMRLLSEERRSGSLTLLLSSPVRMSEIVLGKYLGLFGFLSIMVLMLLLMPLSLAVGTHLDYGKLAACVLGLLLLVGAFAAAGLFMSSLTRQPTVAAVSSFGLLLFLWIINWLGQGEGHYQGVLHYLSFTDHYTTLLRGSFDSTDVIFYLLFITTFLGLTIRRLDTARLQA